jgi:hypothetical protein
MRTLFVISGKTAGGLLASAVLAMSFSTVTHAATTISGTPATSVAANRYYGFQSWATDNTGRPVSYGIKNKPAWATFDTKYGHLYGVPTSASVGVYQNIIVYATDGLSTAYLAPFAITVTGTATTTPPPSGGSTGGSTSGNSATVKWTIPKTNTNGTAITNLSGYVISYGLSTAKTPTTVKVANPSAVSYQISGLTSGTWYFAVSAYNSTGATSSLSNVASKTIQ